MSDRENILSSVVSALDVLSCTVERDLDCPATIPPRGLVIVRSTAPEILDETLGYPRSWYMGMDVPVELYVSGKDATTRAKSFDLLATQVYVALLDNAELLNQLTHIEPLLLEPETFSGEGIQTSAAAQFTVRVEYLTDKSIG